MKTSVNGLLVIDKPGGMTSRGVVNRVQSWLPTGTRLGHTGTLDPLATGALVLCLGAATRLAEYVQRMAKTYRAGLLLGVRSDTDDADGIVTAVEDARPADREALERRLQEFVGAIEQVPPAFSAAKVTGRRAYDLARQGQAVTLQPRTVHVYGIDLLAYSYPRLDIEVRCGKGTYIRSLARDLGERLGCGALIETLRRTRVGPFRVEDGVALDADTVRESVLPLALAVADLPRASLKPEEISRLRQGQRVPFNDCRFPKESREVALFDEREMLVGVGAWDPVSQSLRPEKMIM
jgi:tRNA pseudouridine55 synthase